MTILTIWTDASFAVRLHQLSDEPDDGTAQEQIDYLATLGIFAGWSCVDPAFTGDTPGGDAAQWRWSDGQIVYVPAVPASITFAQLLIGLVSEAWITEAEGEAWLAGTLPAPVLALIATLPAEVRFAAKARAIQPSTVLRHDPMVEMLGTAQGKTSEELDTFFITYSQV